MTDFRQVSEKTPCEICEKPDWCRRSGDGCIECHRSKDETPGYRLLKVTQSGFGLYRKTDDVATATNPRRKTASKATEPRRTYQSPSDAIKSLRKLPELRSGEVTQYPYVRADGSIALIILRFDFDDGSKGFRPIHPVDGGWQVGDPSGPLLLYRFPDQVEASRVYVCEGEKAAEGGRQLGLTCTTSAHGSKSPQRTDWSPLAGRDVVILPDNDDEGRMYAHKVAGILGSLSPPATVRILDLPGLPPKGDLVEFVGFDCHECLESTDIGRKIDALAEEIKPNATDAQRVPATPRDDPADYVPFPVDALPAMIRRFVVEGAQAIGCVPAFVALPVLSVLASAIGSTRRIRLKKTWTEPCVVWAAIVARSGTLKSPALDLPLDPVRRRQRETFRDHETARKQYDEDKLKHERELARWKKEKGNTSPPEKPQPPTCERSICSDLTIEALACLLQDSPRGLLLARDELAGWVGGFDAYRSKKGPGGDSAHWLEMHRAGYLLVDRKTGDRKTIAVPRAAVSICGTIQPGILSDVLGREHFENGLAARLLLAMPPRQAKRWTENELSENARVGFESIYFGLLDLQHRDDIEEPTPVDVPLSPDGRAAWIEFYDAHGKEQDAVVSDDLAAAFAKLEGYAARLALIFHLVRAVEGDSALANVDAVDAASVTAGVTVARWFCHETSRVYAALAESPEDRDQRELLAWISQRGGLVSIRDLQRGQRRFKTSDDARAAIDALVEAGHGEWVEIKPSKTGGRPSRCFKIAPRIDGTIPPMTVRDAGFRPVDSADVSENSHFGDGEEA